jgi:predicted MPP superfamily phosphohydrolase
MIDSLNKISQNSKPPSDQSASSNLGCLNEPLEVPIKFSKKTKSGKKIRIVAVADTHSSHRQIPIVPDGDIFICCGDFTHKNDWRKEEMPVSVKDFNLWLGDLPHKHKIVIAGNHEIGFNKLTKEEIQKQILTHCVYLQDSELLLEGIRFYGTPWTTSK